MVGTKVAVFLGVEVKSHHGRVKDHQRNWFNTINEAGGEALIARGFNDGEIVIT
jgi:hypothetical protein